MSTCLGRMSTLPPLDPGSSAPITDLPFPEMDSKTFEKVRLGMQWQPAVTAWFPLSHGPRGFNQTSRKYAIGCQTILADKSYYTNILLVARDAWSKREIASHFLSLTGGFNISGTRTLKAPRYRNQPRIGNMPRGHFARRLPNISSTSPKGSICMHAVHIAAHKDDRPTYPKARPHAPIRKFWSEGNFRPICGQSHVLPGPSVTVEVRHVPGTLPRRQQPMVVLASANGDLTIYRYGGHCFILLEPRKVSQERHPLRESIGGKERLRVRDGHRMKDANRDAHKRQDCV